MKFHALNIPWNELQWKFVRAGGPGGQNVNKVASKATLRWNVVATESLSSEIKARLLEQQRNRINATGELILESQRFRDQHKNRQDCLDRLQALLLRASRRPRLRKATRPTLGSKERRLRAKQRRSQRKSGRKIPEMD